MASTTITRASGVSTDAKCVVEALNFFEVRWRHATLSSSHLVRLIWFRYYPFPTLSVPPQFEGSVGGTRRRLHVRGCPLAHGGDFAFVNFR